MRVIATSLGVLAALVPGRALADDVPALPAETGMFAGARGVAAKVQAGPAFRRLFTLTAIGVDIDAAVGAQTSAGGWYGSIGLLFGSTEAGLPVRQIRVGPSWEAPLGLVHLGVELPRLSILRIDRVTTSGEMSALGLGAAALASVDIATFRPVVLVGGLRFGGDAYDDVFAWGGSASLGVRFIQIGM